MITDIQRINNKTTICERVNCSFSATTLIKLKVEEIGTITLFLCDRCKLSVIEIGEKLE